MRGWIWRSAFFVLGLQGLACQPPAPARASSPPTLRQTCERAGWNACGELSDGVRRYLRGDFRGADLRFSAVAQVNDALALASAAEAIRRIGRAPDATHAAAALDAAARRLIVFAATPLPPPENVEPAEPPRRSAATIVRTARDVDYAANRTLAAPVDPTRLLTQTADAAPRADSVPCVAVGRPARCTPLLEGPLLVTDIVGSPGCAQAGAIGSLALGPRGVALGSSAPLTLEVEPIDPQIGAAPLARPPTPLEPDAPAALRWVITPPTPGLTGAAFFVSARERLVTVHFDPKPEPAPEPEPPARGRTKGTKAEPQAEPQAAPPSCQFTWAGFRPRALPSQSFPDATRPPIENPYR